MEIPQSRKGFTLDEARAFVDQVMEVFHNLEDMSDLRSMFETGKQLSRAYFDCHAYRAELAQHLTSLDYPAFASKMMKKLNNMGVFKDDDIWFSSFYFYNTTWNFSDTWQDFANALAAAGLPNLLNLNIGHQPYLDNLSSKNVYYLIKASLSIIHNIARVPGNTHYFASDSVRQALLHLAQREEEFLRCVSTLCLAYIITDTETHLVTDTSSNGIDLPRILFGYIHSARVSEKRRCHGFQVIELLCALSAISVHDSVKSHLIGVKLPQQTGGGATIASSDPNLTYISLLKDLIDAALSSSVSSITLREAEEAIRILWNLTVDPIVLSTSHQSQLKNWVGDVLNNPTVSSQFTKAMLRALEALHWKLSPSSSALRNDVNRTGSILFSFSPSNRLAVNRIADRLRELNLPVVLLPFSSTESIALPEANVVGLSMCATMSTSKVQWFDCLDQASIMVVCLSDAYRLSPGCRLEAEYFLSQGGAHSRPMIPIALQPKLKLTGWLTRLSTKHAIEFNGKRNPDASYDTLVSQLKELVAEAKARADAASSALAAAQHRHPSLADGKRQHMAIAGDTGMTVGGNIDGHMNHVNGSTITGSRAPSGLSVKRDEAVPVSHGFPYKDMNSPGGLTVNPSVNSRIIPTSAWRHVIRPEVRNWSTSTVATWLRFRGLGHISTSVAGGIDGVLLSQLAGLRLWSPEYFNQSIRSELGLGFTDSLRFLEALDELAPDDNEKKCVDEFDGDMDVRGHVNALESGIARP